MAFKVVHVLSSFQRINFGIWNAAIFGAKKLSDTKGVSTLALICTPAQEIPAEVNISVAFCGPEGSVNEVELLTSKGFTASETIIVTHGSWLAPARLGHKLKKTGYKWIYSPHGMLEAWSLNHQRLKKLVYWTLKERRMVKNADMIRAVSKLEQKNLEKSLHRKVALIENGVVVPFVLPKPSGVITYLFLARLHHKKGIRPLVEAWHAVNGQNNSVKLIIAGPDEGELQLIQHLVKGNIEYTGAVYGEAKKKLLNDASYYLLPSYSEGFPTSVLEAMSYGQIPLISEGCNFPEVFQNKLGYQLEPEVKWISQVLTLLNTFPFDQQQSNRNREFVSAHYSEDKIVNDLYNMYSAIAVA
jgi:glycosyltransferase involved in cell wall biosynthesis